MIIYVCRKNFPKIIVDKFEKNFGHRSTKNTIIYTPFERSRRVLTLFFVLDFDQTYICRKNTWKTKNVHLFRPFPENSVF